MNCQEIIKLTDVSFSWTRGYPILEGVNLTICNCETVCIVGPNGGGKTTLLNLILGIIRPDSGTVRVFGTSPEQAKRRIGYMPQYSKLDLQFPVNVMDVVLMGRLRRGFWGFYSQADREIAWRVLEEMSVADLARRPFSQLSGGQRQRVLIARALACNPEVLLLDEPTANVDPGFQEQFYEILRQLRSRMSIVIVSHDVGFVSSNINTVVCVNHQVQVHKAENITPEAISNIYGYQVKMIDHSHDLSGCHTHIHGVAHHHGGCNHD
jgi:zinc transport system ATP-binding protein